MIIRRAIIQYLRETQPEVLCGRPLMPSVLFRPRVRMRLLPALGLAVGWRGWCDVLLTQSFAARQLAGLRRLWIGPLVIEWRC